MLAILLILTGLAGAAEAPTTTEPVLKAAPDPVLEWAELDLRTARKARTALAAAAAGPFLYLNGTFAITTFTRQRARNVNYGSATGVGMVLAGVGGVVVGPPLLLYHVHRSRKALEHQGLSPSHTGLVGGAALWFVSFSFVFSSMNAIVDGNVDEARGALIFAAATYVGALGIGSAQMRANHQARRGAGWLGKAHVLPWRSEAGANGLAFAVVR